MAFRKRNYAKSAKLFASENRSTSHRGLRDRAPMPKSGAEPDAASGAPAAPADASSIIQRLDVLEHTTKFHQNALEDLIRSFDNGIGNDARETLERSLKARIGSRDIRSGLKISKPGESAGAPPLSRAGVRISLPTGFSLEFGPDAQVHFVNVALSACLLADTRMENPRPGAAAATAGAPDEDGASSNASLSPELVALQQKLLEASEHGDGERFHKSGLDTAIRNIHEAESDWDAANDKEAKDLALDRQLTAEWIVDLRRRNSHNQARQLAAAIRFDRLVARVEKMESEILSRLEALERSASSAPTSNTGRSGELGSEAPDVEPASPARSSASGTAAAGVPQIEECPNTLRGKPVTLELALQHVAMLEDLSRLMDAAHDPEHVAGIRSVIAQIEASEASPEVVARDWASKPEFVAELVAGLSIELQRSHYVEMVFALEFSRLWERLGRAKDPIPGVELVVDRRFGSVATVHGGGKSAAEPHAHADAPSSAPETEGGAS